MNHDLDLLISFLQPIKGLLLDDSVTEIMGNPERHAGGTNGAAQLGSRRKYRLRRKSGFSIGLDVIANKLGRKLDADASASSTFSYRTAAVSRRSCHRLYGRQSCHVTIRKFSKHRSLYHGRPRSESRGDSRT